MIPNSQTSEGTIDYNQCAKEPITRLGATQSYGAFLKIRGGEIVAYSKNIDTFLAFDAHPVLLRKKLSEVAPELSEILKTNPRPLDPRQISFQNFQNLGQWLVGFRKTENEGYDVEFFPQPIHRIDIEGLEREIDLLGRRFHYPAKDGTQFLNDVCHLFQTYLKLDQIFIQVLQDGEVMEIVAEANNGKIEQVLGLHFSSKEIPIQARELYLKQLIRYKQASHSTPVDVVSDADEVVDLTHSLLREPSKFMTVYMQNISASTLLSMSIVIDQKLSALLTMHNVEPLFLDPRIFERLVGVVRRVSLELLRIDDLIEKNADSKLWELLLQDFPPTRLEALQKLITLPKLSNSLAYTGAVIAHNGEVVGVNGDCPDRMVLKTVIEKASNLNGPTNHTSKLSEDFGLPCTSLGEFAGVMTIKLEDLSVLFFRKSFPTELKWRNSAPVSFEPKTNVPRFSPAGSFEFLIQEVQNQSRPWSEKDIAFAKVLAKWLSEDFES